MLQVFIGGKLDALRVKLRMHIINYHLRVSEKEHCHRLFALREH
jgi:hypothetical protein